MLYTKKNMQDMFTLKYRKWQGIPSIEVTAGGRIFAAFYSGGVTEQLGNFCVLSISDDGGESWNEPVAAVYNGETSRCYDPCLWIDPDNRLWFFFGVMPDHSVYAYICNDPDSNELKWSNIKLIGHDVMMNKPIVSKNRWLLPIAVWRDEIFALKDCVSERTERLSFVYGSIDSGKSFFTVGGADVPERTFDEHMLIEMPDGVIKMYVRTKYGIGECVSKDGGKTWEGYKDSGLGGPNSRFFIGRLPSGNVLLVNHYNFKGRNNLTAMVSSDNCQTWKGHLCIDERSNVSYPDAVIDKNGMIYIIYDRERGALYNDKIKQHDSAREILLAKITEQDILEGKISDTRSRIKQTVSKIIN